MLIIDVENLSFRTYHLSKVNWFNLACIAEVILYPENSHSKCQMIVFGSLLAASTTQESPRASYPRSAILEAAVGARKRNGVKSIQGDRSKCIFMT